MKSIITFVILLSFFRGGSQDIYLDTAVNLVDTSINVNPVYKKITGYGKINIIITKISGTLQGTVDIEIFVGNNRWEVLKSHTLIDVKHQLIVSDGFRGCRIAYKPRGTQVSTIKAILFNEVPIFL